MKKIHIERSVFLGVCGLLLALAWNIDYHRAVNYLFSDEAVYYMMAQSFAHDLDLEYTKKDLIRVYKDGWHVGPQGVFLTRIADFQLTENSFQQLQQSGVPDEVLARLRMLGKQRFPTQEQFWTALRQTIGPEHTQSFQLLIWHAVEIENEKIYYSKSFIYALFLAPWILLFGFKGFLFLNTILLLLMLWMGWVYLRQFNSRPVSLLVSMTFFLLSASFIYTFWVTPEVFNMFCIMLGMFLWLYQRETRGASARTLSAPNSIVVHRRRSPKTFIAWLLTTPSGRLYLAPIPIALAAASKLPNALFILPIVADVLFESFQVVFGRQGGASAGTRNASTPLRWKSQRVWRYLGKLALISFLFWMIFLSAYAFQYVFTGHVNPYAGDRKAFYWRFPFSRDYDVWDHGFRLSNDDYFESSFFFHPKVFFYNIYYYLFGRFTGMLPYFCCSFLALWWFVSSVVRKKELHHAHIRKRFFLLLTIGVSILAYIFMAPTNYQGGGGAFGNRFFLNIYPAFLFLITAVSSLRPLFVTWGIGAIFLAQSLINPFQTSYAPAFHAYRGVYRLLPVELTLFETLPSLVNPHLMQFMHDETPPFRLYFVDDRTHSINDTGFWVRGEESTEIIVRTYTPDQEYLVLTLKNGPISNRVDVTAAGSTQTVVFDAPRETRRVVLPLKWSMPYLDNRLYPVKITSHNGYIPQFTAGSGVNDSRFLGCRVHLSFNPLEIGKALRENQQPRKALQVLEPLAAADPQDIQARYELALAYQDAGLFDAAEQELEECQTLLPAYQQAKISHCDIQGEICTDERLSGEAEADSDLARLLHPLIRRYEAEKLKHSTGQVLFRPEASSREVMMFTPKSDAPGFLVYGPFSEYQAGTYQARFRIKVQKTPEMQTLPSGPALFLEVFHKELGILARQPILSETGLFPNSAQFQEYTLNFTLAYPRKLEFRIYTTGLAQVEVDKIDVYQRLPLQIYEALAQLKLQRGEAQDALELTQELLEVDPWTAAFQTQYLRALSQAGQAKQALEFLSKGPRMSENQTGIASVLMSKQSFDTPGEYQELQQFLEEFHETFVPTAPRYAEFEDRLAFVGYNLSAAKLAPGDHFTIEYVWKALNAMEADYAIFVHFIKEGEWLVSETTSKIKRRLGFPVRQMFQQDHEPLNGAYPTSSWIPGELIREHYDVFVPPDLEPGTYALWIGVWNPLTKKRLHSGDTNKIKIGEITIWPKNGSNG